MNHHQDLENMISSYVRSSVNRTVQIEKDKYRISLSFLKKMLNLLFSLLREFNSSILFG